MSGSARAALGVAALLVVYAGVAVAGRYENTFTEKSGRAYTPDTNVWIYTQSFADRFDMPDKWVNNDLKGAYAVAYRVQKFPVGLRYMAGDPDKSMPDRRCLLDVFVSSDAPIPWASEDKAAFVPEPPDASLYVLPVSKADRRARRRMGGFASLGLRSWLRSDGGSSSSSYVRRYDRALYPGITYLSFNLGCVTPPRTRIHLFIGNNHSAHEIILPMSFVQRLNKEWYRKSRAPAMGEYQRLLRK
ncbi:MAG TPA: hypothetical protein VKA76_12535 [Gammaproteobacteria bacterium]|nr:hypothetical protein [Gammaproteobacteria bacterium]